MACTKASANTNPSQTALLAVIPNPVQVATQLPVQNSDQQASPNDPTMKTPHPTPESYQNFKKSSPQQATRTNKLLHQFTAC